MRISKIIFGDDYIIVPYIAVVITCLIALGLHLHG